MFEQQHTGKIAKKQELIRLRNENPVISDGQIDFLDCGENVFAYRCILDKDALFVYNNLTEQETVLTVPWDNSCEKVIGNYAGTAVKEGTLLLRPYESIVYRR